jgi:TonB-linked SusC/RagA family outer membrane protein
MRDGNRRDDGQYFNAMQMYSISQIYSADGTLLDRPSELGRSYTNPLINELPGYYVNNIRSNRLFSNLFLDWEIVKGLHLKSVLGIDNNTRRQGSYEDYMTKNLFQASLGSKFSVENSMNYSYTLQNTLNYSLTKGKNDIQLLAGQSAEQNVFESHSAYGNAGLDHFLKSSFYDLTNIPSDKRMLDNRYVKSNMLSYFGRINYKLMNRYLLTGTIRGDGSSVLSEGNKWAYFPSLASAWVISEEPFLRDIEAINNLKLRASWGKAGNAAISPYKTLTVLGMDKVPYTFGNSVILGQVPANLGNVNLTWETTETYDGGLDFSILKERISGTIDGYYSKTFDLLLPRGLPATSVFPQVLENVGNTENIGLEAALNFRVIAKKDFSWNSDITFSTNKDKILSLATGQIKDVSIPNAALIVGQPVRAFYNYEPNGTWSIADAAEAAKYGKIPGDVKFVDVNHDYKIDDADKRLYNKSPQFIAGWNNTISYKGLSLSALAYARVGQWISYQVNTWYLPTEPGGGPVLDYWTPEHQNAKFPRPGISSQVDLPPLAFEKASFVKIKEVILGYSLPKKVISNVGISNLRLYGSLQNYFTFSNLKNYDPERGGSASDPLLKQLVFGINLEF